MTYIGPNTQPCRTRLLIQAFIENPSRLKLDVIDGAMEKIHQCCGRDELFGWLITESVSCPLCSHNWIANALLLQRLDGLFLDLGVTLDQE